ncbi:alpha/beta fold hydrolase [Anaeromyxobacter sp. SG26]|uniref:alpha/beta fold hydrolase n=1 Tax=Anaeromyxobacter sp. SG26 TaxID=2925407 RepID=UPI001F57949A|nr:alpha/beta hydrolase [Anaeromyxobacter sp. SG26]
MSRGRTTRVASEARRPRAVLPALLLPGIDGSGRLFAPLLAAAPRRIAPVVVSFPPGAPLGYDALVDRVRATLPPGRFLLVAESFSGPIAIRLAAERPRGLAGLVLAATFLHRPLHPLLHPIRGLVGARLFGLPMPALLVRHFMTGWDAPDALVREVQAAVGSTAPEVMALRAMEALRVDVRDALLQVDAPILVLSPRRDRLIRTDVGEELLALRPDAEVVEVDAPHMILQRAPHACLAHLEELAARVVARPRAPGRGRRA